MAESYEDRKRRLAALRAEAEAVTQDTIEQAPEAKRLKFRNYVPSDKDLEVEAVPLKLAPESTFEPLEDSVANFRELTGVQGQQGIKGFVRDPTQPQVPHNTAPKDQETPLSDLAPKKANWDLKRDVQTRLEKLKRMTDRAVMDLLRAKVLEEQGGGVATRSGASVATNANRIAGAGKSMVSEEDDEEDGDEGGESLVAGVNRQSKLAANSDDE